jgi:periplasmic divalent cation tolerance protein
MTDKIVVLCTCASEDEALAIARQLVEKRLAACVNLVRGVRSIYRWQGNVEDSEEVLLVIKSRRPLFDALRKAVAAAHSYQVPEIIALPVIDGAPSYLDWIDAETSPPA